MNEDFGRRLLSDNLAIKQNSEEDIRFLLLIYSSVSPGEWQPAEAEFYYPLVLGINRIYICWMNEAQVG